MSENFETLVGRIRTTSDALLQDALSIINRSVTARAWITGYYIVEYEQHGNDRAEYGAGLLKEISKRLEGEAFSVPSLKTYRLLYRLYPTLSAPVGSYLSERFGGKGQSAIVQLPMPDGQIGQSPIVPSENQGMIIQADNTVTVSPWHLFLKRENKQDGLA